jgi:succinate dehydrogenase flavoprotein subunit
MSATIDSATLLDRLRTIGVPIDGNVPPGDPAQAWQTRTFDNNLVSPLNRSKFTVVVVGTGLAGGGCAAALG